MRIAKVVLFTFALAAPFGADAIPWTEVGDAGDLPATAQVPAGSGALTSIFGSIPITSATDADMYRIHISVPSAFSATTVGTVGNPGLQLQNSQLFLFDEDGFGVYGRDDNPGTPRTTLPAGSPLGPLLPGDYFLAISGFDRDPMSAGGEIFPDTPNNIVHGPTGLGGAQPISGWTGLAAALASRGNYRIDLTVAEFVGPAATPVAEPETLLLLGIGLFAVVMLRRGSVCLTSQPRRYRTLPF